MALTFKDRVLETSVSIGTGDFICGGAQTGYQPFSTVGDGATVTYTIQGKNLDGTLTGDWEVGVGTYHLSGNYISRDTVLESSNGNAKVYFPAGDKDIFLDLPGERIVQSPTIAVNGNFVSYDGVTGQIIKDSGSKASDFATAAQGAKADTAVQQSVVGQPNGVASLDSTGKVPTSQIPQMGDLNYQGTWNASTNTPTLTSSVGTKGYYYVVNVAGTTNLNGITDWAIGDWAVFNGSIWQKIDNTDSVTSVNGYTGAVVLTQPDIAGTVPTSRTISTGTGLIGGGDLSANRTISFSTASVGTWAANPTSANLSAAMTDETGSGSLVFNTSPLLVTPTLSGALVDNASPYIDFANGSAVTLAAGRMWYNGSTGSWNLGMGGGNITQQVGEELFVYGKASTAVTDSPLKIIYQTGTVGASGVVTFAPTVAGITDGDKIIGCATEPIALNGFGRITSFGVIHNITTDGSAYGETWADGDVIWYNPVTGNPTKNKPSAPNIKVQVGIVINAGSGGSGSFQVEINHGSVLGGTDSNVQLSAPANGNILTYDGTNSYWKNTSLTAGTAISVSTSSTGVLTINNTAPDQTVSITGVGGAVVTGTYPNFTITTPSGTVTNVTGTSPISVATGTTTPVVSMTQSSGTTNGWLSSTDWTTFNNKGSGSVTSVSGTGSVNGITLTGTVTSSGSLTLGGTLSGIGNTQLTNSSVTFNGVTVALGASGTITANTPNALSAGTGLSYTTGTTFDGSAARTLNLANTAVSAGSYTYSNITVDAQGRITAASSSTPVTSFSAGTTGFTPSTATSGAVTLAGTLNVANGGTGVTASTGANSVVLRDASQTINVANTFGFKNRIINGAMGISQRGTSFSLSTSSLNYTLDRWLGVPTGASVTVSQVNGIGGYQNALQITGAASNTQVYISQRIESNNIADLAGTTVTLSAVMQASTNQTVLWQAYYPTTKDNYTSSTLITQGTFSVTTSSQTFSTQISLPSNVINGLWIVIFPNNGGAFTSGTLTITGVQLEKGSTATSFDYRPYGTELALCQRYYEKSFAIGTAPANNIGSGTGESLLSVNTTVGNSYPSTVPFKVTKRTTATVTLYNRQNASNDWAWYIAAGTATNGGVVDSSSDNGFVCRYQSVTTFTVVAGHWTASAEL